ncbi:hypothetical protein P22_1962 [Propionispora sp. 2/2-37]|uniref:phage tail assembly chaperone n=1 Tax=Propionispora sp. 2/2-37 TaxID=1677858 RepID=UPI0006BB6558|nr:hypothetical protein [Propionispora sp. 2/2-37]CUH95876.1 hypothetical protein P22_1962 [Propionispora sp. 2/2-37]
MDNNLVAFLAENAIKAENIKYVASKRFRDANKNSIEWEIRVLTSEEDEAIKKTCKRKVFVPGTRDAKIEFDNEKYAEELIVACVVYPNLNDAALQDSYGVVGAVQLIHKMLTPGEYTDLYLMVSQANGFEVGMDDKKIKQAKN